MTRLRRVVVVGGANVDVVARCGGPADPGSSTPGLVTVCDGGVGRNIAENLARLGTPVALVAPFGTDPEGVALRDRCAAVGIEVGYAVASPLPTSRYVAVLDERGELVQGINDMRAVDALSPRDLAPALASLTSADVVVVDANLPVPVLAAVGRAAAAVGAPVIAEPVSVAKAPRLLDTAMPPPWLVTPNAAELAALGGLATSASRDKSTPHSVQGLQIRPTSASRTSLGGPPDTRAATGGDEARDDQLPAAEALLERGVQAVWLRLGSRGSVLVRADGPTIETPAPAVEVADVTGAGDALLAGFLHAWVSGADLSDALTHAHAVAALTVADRHTVRPDLSPALVERFVTTGGIA